MIGPPIDAVKDHFEPNLTHPMVHRNRSARQFKSSFLCFIHLKSNLEHKIMELNELSELTVNSIIS